MISQYSYTQLLRQARNELSVFPWKMRKAGSFLKKWCFPIRTLHNDLVIGARLLHVDHGVKLASKNWLVHTKQKQMEGWLNTQEKYIPSGYLT